MRTDILIATNGAFAAMAGVMKIREATTGDLRSIQAIYAPYVLETAISFEETVPDVPELATRLEAAHLYLVAEIDERVVGYAYGGSHRSRPAYRHACDVSVYVDTGAQGMGVGHALYGALLPKLKTFGLHRAYGGIALPNAGSIAFHERHGFRHLGTFTEVGRKFGRWHDVGWWEKRL